jgi:hypothetical protein
MLDEFRQEISIMKRLRHPHIVQFVSRPAPACLLASHLLPALLLPAAAWLGAVLTHLFLPYCAASRGKLVSCRLFLECIGAWQALLS